MSEATDRAPRNTKAAALWVGGLFLVLLVAGAFRFGGWRGADLNQRVFHGDEAVNAVKTAQWWYRYGGQPYRYDPHEFHGPSLHLLTLPVLWASGADDITQTHEAHYRWVTVLLGMILVALTAVLVRGLGAGALVGAGWCALSAAMVFYSRYYIHEMPLVVGTFGAIACAWRYALCRRAAWAVGFGVCIGLTHASKETCVIAWFSMAVGAAAVFWLHVEPGRRADWLKGIWNAKHAALAVGSAAFVSVMLFSRFFVDWMGPVDSIGTYITYFGRSGGEGSAADHRQPAGWYLQILAWWQDGKGAPVYSEWPVLLMALVGVIAAAGGWGLKIAWLPLARFFAVYTLVMIAVYSVIPYKTPWCMLGFLHGLVILAGVGTVALMRFTPTLPGKGVVVLLVCAAAGWQARSTYRTNFVLGMHPTNPHIYAHPSGGPRKDVGRLANAIAAVHPQGDRMRVVIVKQANPWPIPFYLRRFENLGQIQAKADMDLSGLDGVPFVVADSQAYKPTRAALKGAYHEKTAGLRPGVHVDLFIRKDLWDAFLAAQESASP